jgi:hypothetical protein
LSQVCIEVVGYLLEELRDAKNYEQFKKDVADANIFIGSLIFIEELAEKVRCSVPIPGEAMQTSACDAVGILLVWVSPTLFEIPRISAIHWTAGQDKFLS